MDNAKDEHKEQADIDKFSGCLAGLGVAYGCSSILITGFWCVVAIIVLAFLFAMC